MRAAPRQDLARSLLKQESGASHGSADLRARAIGALGEGLVTAELEAIGYPFLRNLILDFGNRTVEIDHIIKVPDGLIVLEVKTFSGFVIGSERDLHWTQMLQGQRNKVLNPIVQNLAHVKALAQFLADPSLSIRGFVVSAGRARFCDEVAHIPVPLNRLRDTVAQEVRTATEKAGVERAWQRLTFEQSLTTDRLDSHVRYASNRKRAASSRVALR
jgi:hypothetical protein